MSRVPLRLCKGRAIPVLAGFAVVVALLALGGCGLATGKPGDSYEPERDVRVTACEKGDIGSAEADVRITNRDDQPRSYFVKVKAVGQDGERFATLRGSVAALAPGESVTIEAVSSGFDTPDEFECQLVTVNSWSRATPTNR